MTKATEAKWRALIAAQERSGMAVRAFAEAHGIFPATMGPAGWRNARRSHPDRALSHRVRFVAPGPSVLMGAALVRQLSHFHPAIGFVGWKCDEGMDARDRSVG